MTARHTPGPSDFTIYMHDAAAPDVRLVGHSVYGGYGLETRIPGMPGWYVYISSRDRRGRWNAPVPVESGLTMREARAFVRMIRAWRMYRNADSPFQRAMMS